jgi:hypothetical protein
MFDQFTQALWGENLPNPMSYSPFEQTDNTDHFHVVFRQLVEKIVSTVLVPCESEDGILMPLASPGSSPGVSSPPPSSSPLASPPTHALSPDDWDFEEIFGVPKQTPRFEEPGCSETPQPVCIEIPGEVITLVGTAIFGVILTFLLLGKYPAVSPFESYAY